MVAVAEEESIDQAPGWCETTRFGGQLSETAMGAATPRGQIQLKLARDGHSLRRCSQATCVLSMTSQPTWQERALLVD